MHAQAILNESSPKDQKTHARLPASTPQEKAPRLCSPCPSYLLPSSFRPPSRRPPDSPYFKTVSESPSPEEHVWLLLVFVASALRTCSGPCRAESREAAFKALPTWLVPIMVHFEQLVGREWHGTPETKIEFAKKSFRFLKNN